MSCVLPRPGGGGNEKGRDVIMLVEKLYLDHPLVVVAASEDTYMIIRFGGCCLALDEHHTHFT